MILEIPKRVYLVKEIEDKVDGFIDCDLIKRLSIKEDFVEIEFYQDFLTPEVLKFEVLVEKMERDFSDSDIIDLVFPNI